MTKKEEVSSLRDMLCHNGWELTGSANNVTIYKMRLKGDKKYNTIRIKVASNLFVTYGVTEVSVDEGNSLRMFTYDDLKDMEKAIEYAETNLLMIGVPFVNEDLLHGTEKALKNKIQRNKDLRILYGLDKCEMPRTDKDVSFF